jgi:hypothetical protein
LLALGIVDGRDKPVPTVSDVKDHVTIHRVGILKRAANFFKIVPPNCFYATGAELERSLCGPRRQ